MDEQREERLRERAISHGLMLLRSRDEDDQETPYSLIDTGEHEDCWLIATRMDLDAVEDLLDQADGVVPEDAVDEVEEIDDFVEEVAS